MKDKIKWYNSPSTMAIGIIVTICFMIICSQSFVVVGNNSISLFTSVLNHNTIYILVLVYFVLLMTHFGKKYFNYLNVFLIFIYLMATITSLLTVIQSFSLNTILSFMINSVLLIYLFHTMFRDTHVWKEFKLGNSPFNELSNELYFNTISVLIIISLCVNLISTVIVSGLFISFLEAIYVLLLTRYIYLYREYLDLKKKDINNKGNFNEIKKIVNENITEIKETIDEKAQQIKNDAEDIINDISDEIGDKPKKKRKKTKEDK